jgi:hypothetical protein
MKSLGDDSLQIDVTRDERAESNRVSMGTDWQPFWRDLCSSGMLLSIDCWLVTDFWGNISVPSARVKQSKKNSTSSVKMGPIHCLELLVTKYHCTLGNVSEEWRSHLHHGRSLKSRSLFYCCSLREQMFYSYVAVNELRHKLFFFNCVTVVISLQQLSGLTELN